MLQAEIFQGIHSDVKVQMNRWFTEQGPIRLVGEMQSVIGRELAITLIYRELEDVPTQEEYDRD